MLKFIKRLFVKKTVQKKVLEKVAIDKRFKKKAVRSVKKKAK